MTDHADLGYVDQIDFAWVESRGFGPVASSLAQADHRWRWMEWLDGQYDFNDAQNIVRPRNARCYLRDKDLAAVILQEQRGSDRRRDAHVSVLVGAAAELTNAAALRLAPWPDGVASGRQDDEGLPLIPRPHLSWEAASKEAELAAKVLEPSVRVVSPVIGVGPVDLAEPLATVVAAVLEQRSRRLCGERFQLVFVGSDEPTAQALLRALTEVLGGTSSAGLWPTFSTFEATHNAAVHSNHPHLVFMPNYQRPPRGISRPVRYVFLGPETRPDQADVSELVSTGAAGDSVFERLAQVLVRAYQCGGAEWTKGFAASEAELRDGGQKLDPALGRWRSHIGVLLDHVAPSQPKSVVVAPAEKTAAGGTPSGATPAVAAPAESAGPVKWIRSGEVGDDSADVSAVDSSPPTAASLAAEQVLREAITTAMGDDRPLPDAELVEIEGDDETPNAQDAEPTAVEPETAHPLAARPLTADRASGVPDVKPLRNRDPSQVGPYELLGLLGQGGMGTVYLGSSPSRRLVAVKVVHSHLVEELGFKHQFEREVRLVRRVPRFCTAEVLDVGDDDGHPYLVTEYVNGPTLTRAVARDGPLEGVHLERLAVAVATALTAIHGAGAVHRDLKPSNVMLSPAGPLVIDFGIAHALDGTTQNIRDVMGTPPYMAPEQALEEPVGQPADVFAWGGVMVFAATGRPPFGTGPSQAVLLRVIHNRPNIDGVPEPLRAVVADAMAANPANRPTAQQLQARLLSFATAADSEAVE